MDPETRWKSAAATLPLGALLLSLAACKPPVPVNQYVMVVGTVAACLPETGEMTVRVLRAASGGRTKTKDVYCTVTSDSEVYINDAFSSIERIEIGNEVELIGYREHDARLERFVVRFANVIQPLPAPPLPDLAAPRTGSASSEG